MDDNPRFRGHRGIQASEARIGVVVPCYRVRDRVLDVLGNIGSEASAIYIVDDCCPERSGEHVERNAADKRIRIIQHAENTGVGGAVVSGYYAAIKDGMDVIVKIDGDGQMDPALLLQFVAPVIEGWADYTKGNRFYDLEHFRHMPAVRLFGNAVLSFMAKASTGYWNIFDPTNGYTAINARVAAHLPLDKLSRRYFFETDMLFRLNTLRAVVVDVPMHAVYEDEGSTLRVKRVVGEFLVKHIGNLGKRIFYNYFLRDMSAASFELVAGVALLSFGVVFGAWKWVAAVHQLTGAPLGTIMLAALPTLVGLQLILAFLNFDVANVPVRPVGRFLPPTGIKDHDR